MFLFFFYLSDSLLGVGGLEDGAVLLGGGLDAVVGEEGELDLGRVELLDPGAAALRVGDGLDTHDLNLRIAGAVAGSHVVVGLGDGAGLGDVAELLNHGGVAALLGVVDQGDGVVASGDLLVADDVAGEDVALGGLDLVLVVHEAPEAGLGDDVVGGEDLVLEDGGVGVLLGGGFAADDLVVLEEGTDHCVCVCKKNKKREKFRS